MRIAWLQPWFRRRQAPGTRALEAAVSRWPFTRRNRLRKTCAPPSPIQAGPDTQTVTVQRVTLSLRHHLDVNLATRLLLHQLGCDDWHVACRHDHQLVVQLTRGGVAAYGVSYDCSPAVEKAVCHGSRAWAMVITPLHGEGNLLASKVAELKTGLGELHG